MEQTEQTEQAGRELVIERVLDAPRERVFKAWTDPKQVVHWFGPKGFTLTIHEMDVRPGGVWRYIMHGPDGIDYPNKVVYTEIVEPERLVYAHGSDTEPGKAPNKADVSEQFQVTVTFAEQNGKTKLTMKMLFASVAEREKAVTEVGAIEGANSTLDRLAAHLAAG
jgi:uncharacterized protein YndB with AHSA1/START domain